MIRILVAALLMLILQVSVLAQEQRTEVIQKLYEFTQDVLNDKLAPVRGGAKEKPLGCYIGSNDDMQFRSGYKEVEPRTKCEWAFDLHQYIIENGGGWENYQRYQKETAGQPNLLETTLRSYAGGKDAKDPFDRAHVPYDKQAAFADSWWQKNSRAYSEAIVPPKDWWIHDAVVDGNNVWTRYEQANGKSSADFVLWRDSELAKLLKKN